MRIPFYVLIAFFLPTCLYAEVLVIPSGQGTNLTIAAGEVAIVSAYKNTYSSDVQIIANGITNNVALSQSWHLDHPSAQPVALAGPAEIIFDDSTSHIISYKKMLGSEIQSQILSYGHTNTVTAPEGKTLHFFSVIPNPSQFSAVNVAIKQGTNIFDKFDNAPLPNSEFSGPLDLVFSVPISRVGSDGAEQGFVVSYYFNEDFLVLPDAGLLEGPTGDFQITIEKSVDLKSWVPVVVHNASNDQQAFYRLKLAK